MQPRPKNSAGPKLRLWNIAYGTERLTLPRSLRRQVQRRYDRAARSERKLKSQGRIPFLGIYLDRRTIRGHQYLAAHGLPHSASAANAVMVDRQVSRPILPLMALLASALPVA